MTKDGSMCRPGGTGEGYYAGYINFSTKYGSALQVINEFIKTGNGAQFSALHPILKDYASTGNGAVAGLDGFCGAWKAAAAANPGAFLDAQTSVVNAVYGAAAMRHAQGRGIQFGLTKAALLDIAIVNGIGAGKNAIDDIVRLTDAASTLIENNLSGVKIRVNGKDVDEINWLQTLLNKWLEVNPAAQPHAHVFLDLIAGRQYSFDSKISLTVSGNTGYITFDCSTGAPPRRRR
ncbi:hypothetical protein IWQ56_003483 [Coemansia nantahalensis]|nr:hypothetical protein IWQ56_003483 [Coemansia nantahalensis]